MNHITRPPRFPSMGRPNLLPTYEDLHLSMERESKFNFWCSQLHRSSQPHCSSVRKARIDEIVYIVLTKKLPSSQRILPQAGGDLTLAAQYLSYDLALMFDTCKPSHTAQWFDKIHLSLIRLAASQAGPDYRLQTSASRLNQLLNLNTTVAAILAQNGNGAPASLSFPSVNMPMESQQAPKRPAASSPENPTVKRQHTTDRAEIPGECLIQGCALAWNVKGRPSLIEHIEAHTKPYQCEISRTCPAFSRVSNLNRHRQMHHGCPEQSSMRTEEILEAGSIHQRIRHYESLQELVRLLADLGFTCSNV